ncbi:MAG: DegT/DnrJ/EryC1/StrS family aminotransferase [Candidatus Omnitrophica bacterium]|nr:DegT/DnrJ/EryC1/StrS family aminotransferase [Candidatus Omnitrophota bacterium]
MIKFGSVDITDDDRARLLKVLDSGWLVNGPVVKELERLFKGFTGAAHAVAMNSCTACLHAACVFLKERRKKKKLKVPDITHVATAHAVRLSGMSVDLVDVDEKDGIILPEYVDGNEVVVHLAGQPCEAVRKDTIEDCAHALGTRYKDGSHVGTRGLCGCFSFYPTKHITSGEGGMLVTNDPELAAFAGKFRAFGITTPPEDRKLPADYDSLFAAPNYRMPDILAALLIGQIERFEENRRHRGAVASVYQENLKDCAVLPTWREGTSWFIYQIQAEKRDALIAHLAGNHIETSIHYRRPLSAMTAYKARAVNKNARAFAERAVSLPVHKNISEKDAFMIAGCIKGFLKP